MWRKILSSAADPLNLQSRSTRGRLRKTIPEQSKEGSVARARTPRTRFRSREWSAKSKDREIERKRERKRKEKKKRKKRGESTANSRGRRNLERALSRREGVAARYWRVVRGAHGPHAARISIPTDPARSGADIQGRLITMDCRDLRTIHRSPPT